MKDFVVSVGSMALMWVVGYGVQAAAWVQEKAQGSRGTPSTTSSKPERHLKLVA